MTTLKDFISFTIAVIAGFCCATYLFIKIDKSREIERAKVLEQKLEQASSLQTEKWQKAMINAGFAEYDRKSGGWHLLTVAQVVANDKADQEQSSIILLPDVNLGAAEEEPKKTKSKK